MARTDQPHKLTFDAFVAKSTDPSDPKNAKHANLDYSRPETRAAWRGSHHKIPIWCTVHGEFFEQKPNNHTALGQGCPKCGRDLRTQKRARQDPVGDFRAVHGDTYDYSRVAYTNNHGHVEIVCPAHGSFMQKPMSHLQGEGCPSCWESRRKAFGRARNVDYVSSYAERAARVHKGVYSILQAPTHSHDIVWLNCPKHGDFKQQAQSHLNGHGCPSCGRIVSYAQKQVASFIEALGVSVEHDNRVVLGGQHIDIWVPALQIGVEYHGAYWHSERRAGNKHRVKWEKAAKAGIRLIQVFDFEWLERRDATENRLRALFGGGPVYDARKCELRAVASSDIASFLRSTHTQGPSPRAKAAYALLVGGEVVAAATFGPSRFGIGVWELLRYASSGRVRGGFTRLFRAFLREYAPCSVTSYCDLRWGDGSVYKMAGFTLGGITEPDYWYVHREKRVSRYAAQRRPKHQSEAEWASENGYEKVWGVGHQRWIWTPPAGSVSV